MVTGPNNVADAKINDTIYILPINKTYAEVIVIDAAGKRRKVGFTMPENIALTDIFDDNGNLITEGNVYLKSQIDTFISSLESNIATLQNDLENKLNKPTGSGFFYIGNGGFAPQYLPINPPSYYIPYWNGSSFQGTNIYYNNDKIGVGTGNTFLYFTLTVNGSTKTDSLTVTQMQAAEIDNTFNKIVVSNDSGQLGVIARKPLTQILGSLNATNIPAGTYMNGTIFKKGETFTVHLRDYYIPLGTNRLKEHYMGKISTQYGINAPFEIMFPVIIRAHDASYNNTYHSSVGYMQNGELVVYIPANLLSTGYGLYITSFFQFTNTNAS